MAPQRRFNTVYEFKAKGVKKQKALIKVSADGVFVYGRNKSKFSIKCWQLVYEEIDRFKETVRMHLSYEMTDFAKLQHFYLSVPPKFRLFWLKIARKLELREKVKLYEGQNPRLPRFPP
ncbi:hypothetical protein ACTXT7_003846 [Hymenolepis weldensis]